MTDKYSKEVRKKMMSAVKSKNTKLESLVTKELWNRGFRFRKNVKDIPGKPDIAIKKYKIAIFIDSCFWHGCETHFRMPKSNIDFWKTKINRNIVRDKQVTSELLEKNWTVLRYWEHDIRNDLSKCIDDIVKNINYIITKKKTRA